MKKHDNNVLKYSYKQGIDRHDSNLYCPTSIKYTIHWFPFLSIKEHTVNIINPNKEIIPSLLKVFDMFQLRLFDDKDDEEGKVVEIIAIRYIICKKEIGLYLRNSTVEEMITKILFNTILHHLVMLWII